MRVPPAPGRSAPWQHLVYLLLAGVLSLGLTQPAWAQHTAVAPVPDAHQAVPPGPKSPHPKFIELSPSAQTLQQLKSGGLVLFLRHGSTDNSHPDRYPAVDLADCRTQRLLSEAGVQMMRRNGEAMRRLQISIVELLVSPMCRTRDSAAAAFPTIKPVVDKQLMYLSDLSSEAEKAAALARTRQLLSQPVKGRGNRLVLAHAPNLSELMGYFPREGTLVIFRPLGEGRGYDYLGSIYPTGWDGLSF